MDYDIVTVRVRTGHNEEFTYDSRVYIVDSKKGLKIPRSMAEIALNQHALTWNPGTGLPLESKLYIEDDADTPEATPMTHLKPEEIAAMKDTDGLGDDTILLNGQPVKKTVIDFKNKYVKENFSENNL